MSALELHPSHTVSVSASESKCKFSCVNPWHTVARHKDILERLNPQTRNSRILLLRFSDAMIYIRKPVLHADAHPVSR